MGCFSIFDRVVLKNNILNESSTTDLYQEAAPDIKLLHAMYHGNGPHGIGDDVHITIPV